MAFSHQLPLRGSILLNIYITLYTRIPNRIIRPIIWQIISTYYLKISSYTGSKYKLIGTLGTNETLKDSMAPQMAPHA